MTKLPSTGTLRAGAVVAAIFAMTGCGSDPVHPPGSGGGIPVAGAGDGGEGDQAGRPSGGDAGSSAGKGGKGGNAGKGGRAGSAGRAGAGGSGGSTGSGGRSGGGVSGGGVSGGGVSGGGVSGGGVSSGGVSSGGVSGGGSGTTSGGSGSGGIAGIAGIAGSDGGEGGFGGNPCDGVTCSGHGTCEPLGDQPTCKCDDGFQPGGEPLSCVDIDECATAHGGCDPLSVCSNTTGGRLCGACPAGYIGTGDTACVAEGCGDGTPGVDCPCLWVRTDGDDLIAAANLGLSPFANIQPAITFASEHPNAPRDVCVVGGPTCADEATYSGPEEGLVMHDGVSVHGSYEATDSTACDGINTALELATPDGVSFGPEMAQATAFEYFRLFRYAAEATTAISITGARNVVLRALDVTGAEAAAVLHAIDVAGGAEVVLDAVDIWPYATSTGETIGLHSVGSRVNAMHCNFNLLSDGDETTAVWFEDSPGSSFEDGVIRARANSSDPPLIGLRATGDVSALLIAGNELTVGPTAGLVQHGIAIDGAGDLSMLGNSIWVHGPGIGIEVSGARAHVSSSVTVQSTAFTGYGVVLNGAPGSLVSAAITLNASGAGVRIEGNAEGTSVSNSTIDTTSGGVGIVLGDCGGAAPAIANNPRIAATGSAATEAIVSLGDCHPRITANGVISAKGKTITTGIRCGAQEGVPSRCEVVDNLDIHTEVTLTLPGFSGPSTGVLCEAGGCADISRNVIVGLKGAELGCFRSCYYEAYGVTLEDTAALVQNNEIVAGCGDRAAGIQALGSTTSLIKGNAVVGRGGGCSPAPDNIISSYGLHSSGAAVLVESNSFDPGSTGNETPSGPCTSAGVASPNGVFTGNVFRAGACPKRADFWGPAYPFSSPTFVNNDFVAGAPLYGTDLASLTIDEINALPGASGNFSSP